jgi:hypothetical protein
MITFGGYVCRTKDCQVRVNPEEPYDFIEHDEPLTYGAYRFKTSTIDITENYEDKEQRPFLISFTKPAAYRRIMVTLSEQDFKQIYEDMGHIIKQLEMS